MAFKIKQIKKKEPAPPSCGLSFGAPYFVGALVGMRLSGKTNIIMNCIREWSKTYEQILYVSTTAKLDKSLTHLEKYKNVYLIEVSQDSCREVLKDILEEQASLKKIQEKRDEYHKHMTLLILDDCLGIPNIRKTIESIVSRGRHLDLSFIFTSQNFRSFSNIIRNNTEQFILFNTNEKEREKLAEELSCGLTKDQFKEIFDLATNAPFKYLFVNTKNPNKIFSDYIY
jgi:hypothetical protein